MPTLLNKTFVFASATTEGHTDDEGKWVEGHIEVFTSKGTIQPLSGKDLLAYDTSSRNTGMVKIYSTERLVVRERGGKTGSWVKFGGSVYEVIEEMLYKNLQPLKHFKYVACLVTENDIPTDVKEILGV